MKVFPSTAYRMLKNDDTDTAISCNTDDNTFTFKE